MSDQTQKKARALGINHVVLDGRVTFAPSTRSDVVNNAFLSTWGLTGRAGFEF